MKAIAYIRVSTAGQAETGVSMAEQKMKIEQYADLYGLEIIDTIADGGESAKNLNRPGIQRVLTMMKQGEIEGVIVAKLDRLTRSVRDLADLMELFIKKNISLISVNEKIDTGTAAGRMIVNMLAVISQWERETIGERTQAALEYKKKTGSAYNGYPLYGYQKIEKKLIQDQKEQEIIAAIIQMHQAGYCVSEICRELEKKGAKTRKGTGRWHSKVVKKILTDNAVRNMIDAGCLKNETECLKKEAA
jgi:site-specific DNA recombinase